MPSPPDDQLSRALLQSLKDGTYPDSEDIVSAGFPSSALATELQFIRDAREEIKTDIRRLSRDSAPNVDGWISQAKHLQADIEISRTLARKIVQDHDHGRILRDNEQDASAKLRLLQGELQFNDALITALGQIQDLDRRFGDVKDCLAQDRFLEAISTLHEIQMSINGPNPLSRSKAISILRKRASDMYDYIAADIQRFWKSLVIFDSARRALKIAPNNHDSHVPDMNLETTVSAFEKLGLLSQRTSALVDELEGTLLGPLLASSTIGDGHPRIYIEGETILVSNDMQSGMESLFDDLTLLMKTLNRLLPIAIAAPLSQLLMPRIVSKLTSSWLLKSLPVDISGMEQFQSEVVSVTNFADKIQSLGWPGKKELVDWYESIPRTWLAKRRESSLDDVRRLLSLSQTGTKQVERVEKQKVSSKDDVFASGTGTDDWDAGWSNEDDERPVPIPPSVETDDEDVSAWGLEDEGGDQSENPGAKPPLEDDDGGDAWGWGDEGDVADKEFPAKAKSKTSFKPQSENGVPVKANSPEREYVLRETYHVTGLPESLLELIKIQISDAGILSQEEKANLAVSPAAGGLQTIPTLVLAIFRATAPSLYPNLISSSNMYLYNDSMYLSEQLRAMFDDHSLWANQSSSSRTVARVKLEHDIAALERFGKLSYGKEMESQRRIIADLLDGAQGFTNCSEYPFSSECETAVSSVVDWMRTLNTEWKDILSHSALLQSMGSLLSTVTNKMIVDVEDMNDISEPESQRLAAYCTQISKLEDFFRPDSSPESRNEEHGQQEMVPLTALYTANWLKFQYLSNILESSLADIKYLWTDGELKLEFTTEEVTDLIEALFADSEHRRRAIGEIRRTPR